MIFPKRPIQKPTLTASVLTLLRTSGSHYVECVHGAVVSGECVTKSRAKGNVPRGEQSSLQTLEPFTLNCDEAVIISRAPQERSLADGPDQRMRAVGNHSAMAWVSRTPPAIIDIQQNFAIPSNLSIKRDYSFVPR